MNLTHAMKDYFSPPQLQTTSSTCLSHHGDQASLSAARTREEQQEALLEMPSELQQPLFKICFNSFYVFFFALYGFIVSLLWLNEQHYSGYVIIFLTGQYVLWNHLLLGARTQRTTQSPRVQCARSASHLATAAGCTRVATVTGDELKKTCFISSDPITPPFSVPRIYTSEVRRPPGDNGKHTKLRFLASPTLRETPVTEEAPPSKREARSHLISTQKTQEKCFSSAVEKCVSPALRFRVRDMQTPSWQAGSKSILTCIKIPLCWRCKCVQCPLGSICLWKSNARFLSVHIAANSLKMNYYIKLCYVSYRQ